MRRPRARCPPAPSPDRPCSEPTSHATDPVLHSFAYALDYLREQLADVSPADMVAQPGSVRNHPARTVGHLAHSFELLCGVIGVPPWLPDDWAGRFGTGSVPPADAGAYEPKDAALATLRDAQSRLADAVARLDAARLDEPFPDPAYREVFPTVCHALTHVMTCRGVSRRADIDLAEGDGPAADGEVVRVTARAVPARSRAAMVDQTLMSTSGSA